MGHNRKYEYQEVVNVKSNHETYLKQFKQLKHRIDATLLIKEKHTERFNDVKTPQYKEKWEKYIKEDEEKIKDFQKEYKKLIHDAVRQGASALELKLLNEHKAKETQRGMEEAQRIIELQLKREQAQLRRFQSNAKELGEYHRTLKQLIDEGVPPG